MKKTAEMLLSRNYVEFGPFTPDELSGFAGRGILQESDFVKEKASDSWQPCGEWLASLAVPAPAPPAEAKAPAKKRTTKPKTAA